jgi:hypothetical protein
LAGLRLLQLERDLRSKLKDAGIVRGRDVPESGALIGNIGVWFLELGVVEDIAD